VNRLANALSRLGVRKGDRVGIFLPMSPEAVMATLAVLRLGAIYTPCFSGFGAQAVVSRVQDSEAKVLITADGFQPRGQCVLLKCAHDFAYCMDVGEDDRLFWLTDLGWLMGPMQITGALAAGGTAVMFEGVQDYPGPDRLWSIVERHRVTIMGLSPTAVRALM